MVNKNYVRGRAFEYRAKKYLEKKGYLVIRSAGSKSPFDLVGISLNINNPDVVLVQCKYGAKISKKERDELRVLDKQIPKSAWTIIAWAKPNKPIKFYNCNGVEYMW